MRVGTGDHEKSQDRWDVNPERALNCSKKGRELQTGR